MKKIFSILFISTVALLSSCESKSNSTRTLDTNAEWSHAHISMGDKVIHDEVISYYRFGSDSVSIDLNLKSYGWVKVGMQNCLLYNTDRCPLCGK